MKLQSALALSNAMTKLLRELGYSTKDETLDRTPARFVNAMGEMLAGYDEDPRDFLSRQFAAEYDEMVIVKSVPFWSLCEHHVLPFSGTATVGYLPDGQVVGLSKIPRLVRCLSRRLQMQEKLTTEIADALDEHLTPKGVGVILRATHLCMVVRGVESQGEMVTSSLLGNFRHADVRQEFLRLANG